MINNSPRWEWKTATRAERQVIVTCWIFMWPVFLAMILWAWISKLWEREQIIRRFRADNRVEHIYWDGNKFIVTFKDFIFKFPENKEPKEGQSE